MKSPFLPYLDRSFQDGLGATSHAEFHTAVVNGDCRKLDELRVKGFLGLYPFLAPAFDQSHRGNKLHLTLLADRLHLALEHYPSPGFKHCLNLKKFRRVFSKVAPNAFPP